MLIKAIIFVAFLAFTNAFDDFEEYKVHPDTGLNVRQLIRKYKYPFEDHTVETEDGYILEIHRIPHGRNGTSEGERAPVLVMPGLLCSSADFVNMGPTNSLGFILADQGYDVWLGNYRGTRWSKKHKTWDPVVNGTQFWNISFHQIGYYDIPAFIDYILVTTKKDKLFYVAHSQGTTSFFALASTRPEYNDKVRLAVSLAPVAYSAHATSPVALLFLPFLDKIEESAHKNNRYELLPYNRGLTLLARLFCHDEAPTQDLCALVFYIAAGYSPEQFNKTMMTVIASNTPAGMSVIQVLHYGQLVKSGNFAHYDYGEEKNTEIYGQATPPNYDLGKVITPHALFHGDRDFFCAEKDVNRTASELANVILNKRLKGYNHLDVLWGIDARESVFDDVLALMKEY